MHPDLVKLLELQAKDRNLLEADKALDAILAEVELLDQQLVDGEKAVAQSAKAVADAGKRRQELEAKIDNYKKLEDRGKAHLDQVRNPKEMQAVTTELDLARSILVKEEADWVKQADLIAGLEAAGKEAGNRLEQMREAQKLARGELDLRRAGAEARRDEALAERDTAAAEVNRALRSRYERLRTVKSVRVVVALSGASCGACYTQVPLNRRSQIRAGTLIDACESCGVILYADETVE
jgi:predicted  nucleic acid-binding Zn-ribbon protein